MILFQTKCRRLTPRGGFNWYAEVLGADCFYHDKSDR